MRVLSFLFVLLICCEAKYVPEDGVYAVSETMPAYDAGMDALNAYVTGEVQKREADIKGSVFISFVVLANGEVKEFEIVNGVNETTDLFAKNILQNAPGKWLPGTEEGKPVDVKMVYPVRF